MHDIQDKLGVKNMSDLTIKAIKGIYNIRNLTEKQIKKYKKYGKEFIDNLTGIYIHEDIALLTIMNYRATESCNSKRKLVICMM